MTSKYKNKNGGKKLAVAVLVIAMMFVSGLVIVAPGDYSDGAASTPSGSATSITAEITDLPSDGMIQDDSKNYKVTSSVSLTIPGQSSTQKTINLYVAQGVTVTIVGAPGASDSANNIVNIIPADKDCASHYTSNDSSVGITGLVSGSIIVSNNSFGSNGVASVMTVSNNSKATANTIAFTQGDVRIGSSGLETTCSISNVEYGILVQASSNYKYNPVGASVSVTLAEGNIVTVMNGSATVTQTINNKDNTISLSKVVSTAGVVIKGVADSAGNFPTVEGEADDSGLITITTGQFRDAYTESAQKFVNSNVNAVVETKTSTANVYMNQIPAETSTESLTYEIWGTISQISDVNLKQHDTGFKDASIKMTAGSTLLVEEGVTVAIAGLEVPSTGNADVRIFGTVESVAVSGSTGTIDVLLGSTGVVSGGLVVTGSTNVRFGEDNLIGKNLYSELPEDAILGEAATIPEGTTYTLKANLGLNGQTLTVNGTLIIEAGCEIFGTGIAAEEIVLGQNGSIINNGVIGAVTGITVGDGTNGVTIKGVSGIQFGYVTVSTAKNFSISGEVASIGADSRVEVVGAVYVGADLIIGDDVTLISVGTMVIQKGVDIIIDGTLEGTLNMGTVSEIQINGKLAKNASIVIPVGESDRNGASAAQTIELKATVNYVSGFIVSTVNVKTGTSSNPVYTMTAYIYGEISTKDNAATLTLTGSVATQTLTIAEGAELTINEDVTFVVDSNALMVFDGMMIVDDGATATCTSYTGAMYEITIGTGVNAKTTTYYTNFADAVSVIAQADDTTVTAKVTEISTSFTLNDKEIVILSGSAKITSDAEVKVLQGGKLQGSISKVEGLLYIAKGVTGTTVVDYDSKKVDSAGNTTYSGLKVALRDAVPGDVLTIKSANVTESLAIPAGVKVIITESLTVKGDLTIPEGSELVAPNITVNGKDSENIADVIVEGTLDLSAGSVLGTYNAVYSTGTVILRTPSTNMNGAYYQNDDGKIVLTTIAKAVASGEDVTVIGTVSETSDVIVKDAVFNIASSAVVTVGSITLDGASIVNDGTLTTVVKAASGIDGTAVVSVSKTTAGFATSSSVVDGETVYVLSIDAISGTVSIKEGAVTIKTVVTAAEKSVLTVDEGAELIIAENTTLNTLNSTVTVDGTITVSKNLTVKTNDGSTTIVPLIINGIMNVEKTGVVSIDDVTVLGTLQVVKNGSFTTEAMTVGKSPFTTGADATVVGKITISVGGYVKVYAGAVASVEDVDVASFSINGADYAVVYFNGTVSGATVFKNDDFSVPGYVEISNPWTEDLDEKSYNKDLTPENVSVTVSIEPGTQLKIGALFYGTTGPVDGGMPVGTYSVSAKALPGYTGTAIVELWIDGVQQDPVKGTITLTTDMIGKEVIIVSTFGITPTPEPTPEPGTAATDVAISINNDGMKVTIVLRGIDGYVPAGQIKVNYTFMDDGFQDFGSKTDNYVSTEESFAVVTIDLTAEQYFSGIININVEFIIDGETVDKTPNMSFTPASIEAATAS